MTQASNVGILTPNINSSGVLGVAGGGTGLATTPANGALDIGNGTGFTRTTLTQGSGITITNGAGSITIAASGGGGLGGQTVFTSSGTFTIPSGKTVVKVTIIGGGGGSGGANWSGCSGNAYGGGGGGGGGAVKYLTGLTPGNTLTVTVGNGGTAGGAGTSGSANATAGGTGGTSSVASGTQTITTISATGGAGGGAGNNGAAATPTSGGVGSNGDYNLSGLTVWSNFVASISGAAALGFSPTKATLTVETAGTAGGTYGGGASGAFITATARAGAVGGAGIVIFEY